MKERRMAAMNLNRRSFRGMAVGVAVLVAFATLAGSAVAKSRPLFGEQQGQVAARSSHRRAEIRGRRVKVDVSAVAGVDLPDGAEAIELNLFTDNKFEAVRKHFKRRDKNHFTWVGKVSDDPLSTVVLVGGDGHMRGLVFAHGKHFSIQGADAASQEIVEVDQRAFPKENCDQPPPRGGAAQTAPSLLTYPDALADTGSTIDVLVVYTPAAASAAGGETGMLDLIDLAIATTNDTYENSGITPRLNLVHAEEISYVEKDQTWNTDLSRLSGVGETGHYMDNVHTLRDTYSADVVVLLIDNPTSCGLAYISATAPSAFAVVAWDCAVSNYSFGHEIGHLQGARHDLYVDPIKTGYNHGDVDLTLRRRTVMAYNNQCDAYGVYCTRLPYWSNPDAFYPGSSRPMGSQTYENNVRKLNETAYAVANFRPLQLTVQSTYPAAGVQITVSPADKGSASSGTTPVTFAYNMNTSVTLTAQDPNDDGFSFLNWSGCLHPSGTSCTVLMDGSQNETVTANYATSNYLPTLNAIANRTISEDAGVQTVNLSGITYGPDAVSQTLLGVTATSSNPALIPDPAVLYTPSGETGSLSFTPVADASGTATITVTVTDSGPAPYNTFARTFDVTVNAVNDTPTLDAIPNVVLFKNAGEQTIALAGISAGGGESQPLTVTAVSSKTSLLPNPTVVYGNPDPTGSLRFTPATNAYGTATITVTVRAGGGLKPSDIFTRSFVVRVNDPPTLNVIDPVTINEDAGKQTVALKGIYAADLALGRESQSLKVTAVSLNPGLIPNPTVSYSSPNATGSLSFKPVANANGTATITVTVSDGQKGNSTFSRSFVVTVNAVNDPPTLNAISNRTINEDAVPQPVTVALSGIAAGGGETQDLALAAISSNLALIPDPIEVVYASPGTTGSLRFTLAPDAYGTATITVTVRADGGLASNDIFVRRFVVTVRKVNDAPSFVRGLDQVVAENVGAQTVSGWATDISAGPSNESAQTLSILTTNSNPGLFGVQPAVAAKNGNLLFRPAANKFGKAWVTVRLHDSGGTANGGVDTSVAQTFKITVTAVAGLAALSDASLSKGVAQSLNSSFVVVVQTASTAAELQAALDVAGANGQHDTIRLAGGRYALSANAGEHFTYSSTEDKDLVIEGGWTPDFSQRAANIPTALENDVPVTLAGSGGVLEVTAGGSVSLSGIAMRGGQAAGSGGGVHVTAAGSVVVGNCQILNNAAGGDGGGLFLESTGGDVRLYGSTIQGNSGARGGGGLIKALSVSVQSNEISGNTAVAMDGGLQASVISGGSLIVSNNTIYGNQAPAGSSGLSVAATGAGGMSVLDVYNNIVYGNGAAPNFVVAPDSDCVLNYLDLNIVNNDIACYEMCPEYLLDGSNSSVDFSGRGAGTFRLVTTDTALIDQGSPYTVPSEDIEGDAIPLAGQAGAGAVPDIGADEYNPQNIAGPASVSVSASGNITAANDSVTITAALDAPAKRDLVLFLSSGDAGVVSLTTPYISILRGSSSAQTVVQAANGATNGVSTITATDPSGRIAQGSVNVSVDIVK